jgi:hypothetical protein
MHALLSMIEKTCDERRSLSASSRRVHVPFSVLIGLATLGGIAVVVSVKVLLWLVESRASTVMKKYASYVAATHMQVPS